MPPRHVNLARAGSLMAAAWFELCGHSVSRPLVPCRYDLLVWMGTTAQRIQVKTTTVKQGTSWTVWISNAGKERTTYDPDEIDHFFVIDGNFDYYLIPVAPVGGLTAIQLSAYRHYRLLRDAHCQPLSVDEFGRRVSDVVLNATPHTFADSPFGHRSPIPWSEVDAKT